MNKLYKVQFVSFSAKEQCSRCGAIVYSLHPCGVCWDCWEEMKGND